MNPNISKIIVIDNDLTFHDKYQRYFESYLDYSLNGIHISISEALAEYDYLRPDIIFSEVALTHECGIEGIRRFRKKDPNVKIIMLSAHSDIELVKKAFNNGANGYLSKPVTERTLYNALDSINWHSRCALQSCTSGALIFSALQILNPDFIIN